MFLLPIFDHEQRYCEGQLCAGVPTVVESVLGLRRSVQAVQAAVRQEKDGIVRCHTERRMVSEIASFDL